jgi:DNA-binding NarL/FixJ family response regulator
MRLLWVENHAVFVRVAGKQFLSAHAVTVAGSLAEARDYLAKQTFDVVLLDYDLDDGKGTSLFASLAELPNRPLVIAASAHQDGNEALLQAGADTVCPKGQFDEIDAVIRRTAAK